MTRARAGCFYLGSIKLRRFARTVLAALVAVQMVLPAWAWDARGHRLITYIALDGLSPDAPAWLRDPAVRDRIAYESNEPDRWRGVSTHPIGHENKPEHYLDLEDLQQFGLTLNTVPKHRYEYLRAMAVAKYTHPEAVAPYDAKSDDERTKEWPGFLPHAIVEHYAKLVGGFNTVRILEKINDPRRAQELEMARANCLYHMGMLSHFVGDAAQPLHTTRHHHGWTGENPQDYTKDSKIHSYIDGGVLRDHGIVYETLRGNVKYDRAVESEPWDQVVAHIQRAFDQVEPLYKLEKSGDLKKDVGKQFILERLSDGASMLAAMYNGAWTAAEPTDKQIADWQRYSDFKSEFPQSASAAPAQSGAPAGAAAPGKSPTSAPAAP